MISFRLVGAPRDIGIAADDRLGEVLAFWRRRLIPGVMAGEFADSFGPLADRLKEMNTQAWNELDKLLDDISVRPGR